MNYFLTYTCLLLFPGFIIAQAADKDFAHLFTTPKTYAALKTNQQITIDGKLNEPIWNASPWSAFFVDIEGDLKPLPTFNTQFKICWDDAYLYIAALLEEPHINGVLDKRDQVIYYDNDFEVFLDPKGTTHNYFEIEINALNTIFDLKLNKPYRNGGRADIPWDVEGLKHAVAIHGTLNQSADIDSAWIVEMAIPFTAIEEGKPASGDSWNINFSRVQWKYDIIDGEYVKSIDPESGRHYPEDNWVWSQQGVINMHFPERWGYLYFLENKNDQIAEELPAYHQYKEWLFLLYYRQKDYLAINGQYANSLVLEMTPPQGCKVQYNGEEKKFTATLNCGDNAYSINEEGLFIKK